MIRKAEILRDYTRKSPLEQVQIGQNFVAALMANPTVFVPGDLPVSAADLTASNSELSSKYNDYKLNGPSRKGNFLVAQAVWLTPRAACRAV